MSWRRGFVERRVLRSKTHLDAREQLAHEVTYELARAHDGWVAEGISLPVMGEKRGQTLVV